MHFHFNFFRLPNKVNKISTSPCCRSPPRRLDPATGVQPLRRPLLAAPSGEAVVPVLSEELLLLLNFGRTEEENFRHRRGLPSRRETRDAQT